MPTGPALLCTDLRFGWRGGEALIDIGRFAIAAGETVFLQGASGSGKSTLLGLVGGVLEADGGSVEVLGQPLEQLRRSHRDRFRGEHIGYIAQTFNLIPHLSVHDNIVLPTAFAPGRRRNVDARGGAGAETLRLLAALGLDGAALAHRPAGALSQGQQQRVAAARALLGQPPLLIADEPTSALDDDARDRFLELLLRECAETGAAVLFVSHDRSLARHFDRSVTLRALNRAEPAPC